MLYLLYFTHFNPTFQKEKKRNVCSFKNSIKITKKKSSRSSELKKKKDFSRKKT